MVYRTEHYIREQTRRLKSAMSLWFCYPDETWRALYVALLADKPEGIDSLTADEIVALCAYLETSDALASVEPYGVDFR